MATHGRIVWHELQTTDPRKAMDFYTALLGWKFDKMPGDGEPYWQLFNGKDPVGGVMKLPAEVQQMGVPPHWMLYVAVDDTDKSHAQALKQGAQSHVPPTDIPTVGRFAVLQDPQGAAFAIIKPEGPDAPEAAPKVGEFSWDELATSDYTAAADFYGKLFGWEKRAAHDMGPMGIYQIYGRPGVKHDLGGMFNKPPEMPVSAFVHYVSVTDLDGKAKQVKQLGGQVIMEPMDVPGGDRIMQCQDSTGAHIAFHEAAKG